MAWFKTDKEKFIKDKNEYDELMKQMLISFITVIAFLFVIVWACK